MEHEPVLAASSGLGRYGDVNERPCAGHPAGAENFHLRLHEGKHVVNRVARSTCHPGIDNDLDVVVVERGKQDELFADFTRHFLGYLAKKKYGARLEKFFLKLVLGLFFFLLLFLGESSRSRNNG